METTTQLIDDILDMELEMFLAVPSDGRSAFQQHPDAFKFHCRLQFSVRSTGTLSCYREDLRRARQCGENLMAVKYARMRGLIPPIDAIVDIEMDWQAEMMRRCPAVMGGARPLARDADDRWMTSFETYARGELETYSDATPASLHADLQELQARGVNASERIYRLQAQRSGFSSLESAEAQKLNLEKRSS